MKPEEIVARSTPSSTKKMPSHSTLSPQARCRICNNLDYQGHQDTDTDKNKLRLQLVFSELDRDCPLCRLIVLCIESTVNKDCWRARAINPDDGKEKHASLCLYLMKDGPMTGRFRFESCYDKRNYNRQDGQNMGSFSESKSKLIAYNFMIYSGAEVCPILPSLTKLPPFRQDSTLDHAKSIVRRGQSRCSESHGAFPRSRQPDGFVPTRLICIASEAATIRLVQSIAGIGPYATLSYCWGGARPLCTTKANLSARLHCIPEESLPVMYHQAIQLARNLEIPYIWIDSLCIIQDSVEDWEAESQRMSLYYKHGSINIAAANSDNPNIPITKVIDETWYPIKVKVNDSQGTPSLVNARRLPSLLSRNGDLGTLFTRAWTFQESVFATHTINFTSQGVVWSCQAAGIVSDNYLDPGTKLALNPGAELRSLSRVSSTVTCSRVIEKPRHCLWRQLVNHYSNRVLTFPMDRLPALSGAAAHFYGGLHCTYLAGHWYDDLPQSLIWFARKGPLLSLEPLPREYVAPSWSWASVTTRVMYPIWGTGRHDIVSPAAKLVDIHCNISGKNPYGKVSSGFIDLRGNTVPTVITSKGFYRTTTRGWHFDADCALRKSGDSLSRAISGEPITDFESRACCLYLASLKKPCNSHKGAARPLVTHYALVLGWSEDEQSSFFRVGIMESTSDCAMELFDNAIERTVRIL